MRTSNFGPLVAILSSSVLSFTAGRYLPYVITAISGSGAIAAVPLAIFAVSTVVALISVAYLVKLAVSRVGNKKEVGLSGEASNKEKPTKEQVGGERSYRHVEQGSATHTKFDSNTSLKDQLSVTPTLPPVTLGAQPNSSASVPPPPPPLPQGASPPPPPPPPPQISSSPPGTTNLFAEMANKELKKTGDPERKVNGNANQGNDRDALLAVIRAGVQLKPVKKDQQNPGKDTSEAKRGVASILARRAAIEFSDSESEVSDGEWDDQEYSTPQILTSGHKNRSGSSDSGNVSDDDANQQKPEIAAPPDQSSAEKPLIPLKPANLHIESKAPPIKKECDADPVNGEMQDPSTSSVNGQRKVKDLTSFWENQGG